MAKTDLGAKSVLDTLAIERPDVLHYVEPELISHEGKVMIFGPPATWKSFITIDLAVSLVLGRKWLGTYQTVPSKVMIIQVEQSAVMYSIRLEKYLQGNRISPRSLGSRLTIATQPDLMLDNMTGLSMLEESIKKERPDVIGLDDLYRSVRTTSDDVHMKPFLGSIARLQKQYNFAWVMVHHPRKPGINPNGSKPHFDFNEAAGWAGISRWCDTILSINHLGGGMREVVDDKRKNTEEGGLLYIPQLTVDRKRLKFLVG